MKKSAPAKSAAPTVETPTVAVIPPRPEPTPEGAKDLALMEWMSTYHPEQFVEEYQCRGGTACLGFLASARHKISAAQ